MPEKEGAEEKSTKSVVNKKQKQMMGEEGYDHLRDQGRIRKNKKKKDATTLPVSDEVKKTQKVNKGPSALERVKADIEKRYGKDAIMKVMKESTELLEMGKKFGPGGDPIKKKGFIDKSLNKLKVNTPVKKIDTDTDVKTEEAKSLFSTPGLDKLKKLKDFKSNADRVFGRKSPDLTKVAESFGGEIIGEPIELDEGKLTLGKGIVTTATKAYKFLKSKPGRKTFQQFVDLGRKYKGKVKTFFDKKRLNKIFNKSKDFENIGGPDYYSRIPKPPIKEPFKPLKPLKDFIRTGTEKAKTQFSKIKDALRPKKKTKNRYDTYVDDLLKGNRGKNMGKNKSKIGTTTKVARGVGLTGAGLGVGTLIGRQTKKGDGGKFRPRLPQTSHNIGRTSNPQ